MSLVDQFYACVVRNGAAVMGDVKPAALFGFSPRRDGRAFGRHETCLATRMLVAGFNRKFQTRGLRIDVMDVSTGRALLLLSRPRNIDELLRDEEVCALLGGAGIASCDCGRCVASLGARIAQFGQCRSCAECSFPHEVGVLLGYPLEDVRGFIADGGRGATACGPWKTYGDVDEARLNWERQRACRRAIERNYANGTPFEALIA